jgi:hypothetical protein
MTHLLHTEPLPSDDRLAQLATAHLTRSSALQLVAELLTRLRDMNFPWWTPEQLRRAYPSAERMRWLEQRPDVRQRITTQLTGLAPRAARNKSPEFQSALIDSVLDEGDIGLDVFESAFEPVDIAVYGPAEDFFQLFRRRMPWEDDSTPHQDLIGWLIGAFLSDKCSLDGSPRTPILSALDVRTAIDGAVWHSRVPLHVRVAIDEARFASHRERPHEPFTVDRDLAIATPALIAASIPLKDLLGVVELAASSLGFDERGGGREHATRSAGSVPEVADEVPRQTIPPASPYEFTEFADEPTGFSTDGPAGPSPELASNVPSSDPPTSQRVAASEPAPPPDFSAQPDYPAPVLPMVLDAAAFDGNVPLAEESTGALDEVVQAEQVALSLSDGWEVRPAAGLKDELESTNPWAAASPELSALSGERKESKDSD